MNKSVFPILALIISVALLAILISVDSTDGQMPVPVLMLLFMSELGFFVAGAGAFIAARLQFANGFNLKLTLLAAACSVLAIMLALRGFDLWTVINSP